MNDVLANLLTQLKNSGPSARWALGAVFGFVLLVAGTLAFQARNPHFVVLAANLDNAEFNTAITALAGADIRYETTMGPAPYVIKVEEAKKYEALNAIFESGDFKGGARGISSGSGGASSVFLGQSERQQRTQKRMWQETEILLEKANYIDQATVTMSGAQSSPLARTRPDERRVSVVLKLSGIAKPTPGQTRALVGIVRGSTGVAEERIMIADQHSTVIFDGSHSGGADSLLAHEEQFSTDRTNKAQRLLDSTFASGLSVVSVNSKWKQVREETISSSLDPSKKPRSERTRKTETPEFRRAIGGPAGVAANTQEGSGGTASAGSAPAIATTSEKETAYTFGQTTTHNISQPLQLERISISLVLDASLKDQLEDAIALVKGAVGFDESRGDQIVAVATALPTLERDADGAPILPEAVETPDRANPMMQIALEHGLELVAGIAFLLVLLKSLKSAKAGVSGGSAGGKAGAAGGRVVGAGGGAGGGGAPGASGDDFDSVDEAVDMDALARAHIEELLQSEPEKVSMLLSRWALAEDAFAQAGAK